METLYGGIAAACIILAFFGGIAFCSWIDHRLKGKQRQLEHEERLRSLEAGIPLPDAEVARAKVDGTRAWMAGLIGTLVPLVFLAAAVTMTFLAWRDIQAGFAERFPLGLLAIIWGTTAGVSLLAVILSLVAVRRGSSGSGGPRVFPKRDEVACARR